VGASSEAGLNSRRRVDLHIAIHILLTAAPLKPPECRLPRSLANAGSQSPAASSTAGTCFSHQIGMMCTPWQFSFTCLIKRLAILIALSTRFPASLISSMSESGTRIPATF
jgi:hypothetical protein